MNDKSRQILWVLVGGYLAYLGGTLIKSSLEKKPENYIIFLVCGVVFIIVGILLIIRSIKAIMAPNVEGDAVCDEDEEEGEDEALLEETAAEVTVEETAAEESDMKESEEEKKAESEE